MNIDLIKRAVNEFDYKKKAFSNIDVDKMVYIFNKIIDVLCNFIPHEMV